MKWSNELIQDIEHKIASAGHGQKKLTAEQEAEKLGVSVATLYRHIDITNGKKKAPREPEIPSKLIDLVAAAKTEPALYGRSARYMTTEDAIAALEDAGKIEPGLLKQPTVDARLRRAGFNQPRVYSRHEDDFVNQVHQLDWSVSECLTYAGMDDEGNHMLAVDGSRGAWSYKNKDKPTSQRLRLWVGSYLDTYSRAWVVRYFASPGESLNMAIDLLEFVWQRQDQRHPFKHMPIEVLKTDQGSISKSKAFKRGLDLLNIRFEPAASKSDRLADHQGMGKVERRFRILWQKELKWVWTLKKRGQKVISLDQLNALAHDFCTKRMQRKHPVQSSSIDKIYRAGLHWHEQQTISPDFDLRALFWSEDTRKVSATSDISIDNQLYKVPEKFAMQEVYYCQLPDGHVIGMSMDRHETFGLIPFDAAKEKGKRLHTPTYKERIAEQELEIDGNKVALTEQEKEAMPDNVHTLGAREKEQAPETPFQPKTREEVFQDWDLAKAYICESFSCRWIDLTERTQNLFNDLFETKKLDKRVIDDLSQTAS